MFGGQRTNSPDSTKKLTALDHQMNSATQRFPLGFTRVRSSISWFFITVLIIYLLYSSNVLLNQNNSDCTFPVDVSNKESIEKYVHVIPTHNTSSTDKEVSQNEDQVVEYTPELKPQRDDSTELKHIVFGIAASSNLWNQRKEYIKLWWRPNETRGVVWLDNKIRSGINEGLPEIRISANTSKFKYTNRQGKRSALRISRVVSETLRLGLKDVRWFVMGDDDTVFMIENVVRVLSKYDHNQYYYIGSSSESHVQNILFSYAMAYGGGGFAISYPLAKELEKMQDRCLQRYPGLYGSDDRIQACMAELGVPLTREIGFHQVS